MFITLAILSSVDGSASVTNFGTLFFQIRMKDAAVATNCDINKFIHYALCPAISNFITLVFPWSKIYELEKNARKCFNSTFDSRELASQSVWIGKLSSGIFFLCLFAWINLKRWALAGKNCVNKHTYLRTIVTSGAWSKIYSCSGIEFEFE